MVSRGVNREVVRQEVFNQSPHRFVPELSWVADPTPVPLGSPSGIYNAEILFLMKKQRICLSGRA
jgi:hypothetical protein